MEKALATRVGQGSSRFYLWIDSGLFSDQTNQQIETNRSHPCFYPTRKRAQARYH